MYFATASQQQHVRVEMTDAFRTEAASECLVPDATACVDLGLAVHL